MWEIAASKKVWRRRLHWLYYRCRARQRAGRSPPDSGRTPVSYVDFTITRLADESLRASLFDQDALEHILQAAYHREAMTLDGPYIAVFEQVVIGLSVPRRLVIEGRWGDV
jgi:hypothetical protein